MKEDKEAEHNEILHQHYQTATHNASPRNDPEAEKKPPPVGTAVIPLVGGTSQAIERVISNYNIKTVQ